MRIYCIIIVSIMYVMSSLQGSRTALILASGRGHTNVVQILLAAGAYTDAVSNVSYISI